MLDRNLPQPVVTAIEAANIPPLPQVLVRLMQQIDDENSTMDALAAIVAQDPGLCARVLTAATSVTFHRSVFTDIKSCVTMLGTRLIRSMATCLAVKRLFEPGSETVATDLTDFWRHSLLVAETARALAVATKYPHPDEAYLAGLVHDAGQLLLLGALDEKYAWLLSQSADEDQLSGLERTSLATDHAEIGAWLAEQWQLDSGLADAILFHHADAASIATASMLPRLVWFADALARDLTELGPIDTVAQDLFGAELRLDTERILARALDHVEVVATAMGIAPRAVPEDAGSAPTLPGVTVLGSPHVRAEADRALERRIADVAIMHPLQQDLFGLADDGELLKSLRESARILFDLPRMGFLLLDRDSGTLSGESIADQAAIFRQTRLAHGADAGLATRAVTERVVCTSFDEPTRPETLLDRQLARAFSSEGILAIPMVGRLRTIGVMLFALNRGQYPRLKARSPWLLNFGRIGGLSLEAWQDTVAFRKQAEDEAATAFHRHARRIVHEAGNPLGIIKSYLRILDKKLPGDSEVRHEIEVLREEIDRVGGIVRRLSEVPAASAPSPVGAAELVRELLALYGPPLFADRGISVATTLAEDAGRLACDIDSLKQILVNLMKNASEAMPDGGRFDIQLLDGVVQDGRKHVEISLQDNGPGMPEAAMLALSHPDQSPGRGERGHGLAIVGTLASRIGCKITCRSKPQVGTTISLLLPCTHES